MKTHSQQTIQSKFTSNPRRSAVINATIVLALSLFVWWQANQWYQATLLTNQRSQIEGNLIPYGNALTSVLNQRFTLLEGLAAFVKISPTDADLRSKFTPFVSGLYIGKQDIRAIQIFPKVGTVLVYPIEANEATIGRTLDDLIHDDRPDVRADVQRTIQTRQIAISGPYELRQGGLGMVARLAIYQDDTLLGIAAIILDMPPLLEAGGLANPQPRIRLALKDSSGQILTGSEDVFSDNPVTYTIVLPDGEWELAAMPPDGWTVSIRNSLRIFQWTGLLIIALATSLAYLITNHQARLTWAVQEQTASLTVSIAKREQANEALRESEQYNRMLFDSSPIGLALCRMDGSLEDVNPAYAAILGRTVEETLPLTYWDITPKDYAEQEDLQLQSLEKTGRYGPYEKGYIHKDGHKVPVRLSGLIIERGGERFIWSSVEDITERKRAEEALRESEQRFSILFNKSAFVAALSRLPDGVLVDVNEAFEQVFGFSKQEAIGKTSLEVGFNPDAEGRARILAMLKANGSAHNVELPLRMKSGEERIFSVNIDLIDIGDEKYILNTIQDITERRRAEQTLQRNEQVLRLFVEYSPAAIAMFDRDMKYVVASHRYLIDYGLGDQNLVGRSHYELFPEIPERWKEIHRRCLSGAIEKADADPFPRADGTTDWVRWEIHPWYEHPDEIGGIILFSEVITERKHAEEEIHRRNAELTALNTLGRQVSQSISLNDVVSQAITEMVKVTQTDVAFLFLRDGDKLVLAGIGPQSGAEKYGGIPEHRVGECICGLAVREGKPLYSRNIYSDLRCTWEECKKAGYRSFAALPLRSGTEIIGVAGLACLVERDFETQTDFLETLASQVSSGIHNAQLYEEASHHLNQLTALNKAALQLQKLQSPKIVAGEIIKSLEMILNYTYSAILLIDESGERLIPFALSAQKQDAPFVEQDKRYIESNDIRVGKGITGWVAQSGQSTRLGDVRQDGRYLGIRADIRSELCVPLKVGERVTGVINIESTQVDAYSESDERVLETVAAQVSIAIQNARLFEQVQEQTAELEQRVRERTAQLTTANKELETFTYSVSHDLRAPLRAVSGFAEIVARRHRADLNEEGQHYVDNIVQASERMGHLIDDLLTYSRLGRGAVRREQVALSAIVQPIVRDLAVHLKEIGATLEIADDLPTVIGDQTLLSQIFTNLLENALAYRKPDVPARVTVTCQINGDAAIVGVTDNGIGISSEHHERIFNIFQRLHSEDKYPGTGIGLATVKKSVELLGGSVWVESKVGEGSTFFIKLPKE